jgi:putative ABC transport system ATP-binding protein
MELLRAVMREEEITVIVATHDPRILDVADRVIELRDGMLVGQDGYGPGLATSAM